MMMDFMERLEEKLRSVRNQEDCSNSLALLVSHMTSSCF